MKIPAIAAIAVETVAPGCDNLVGPKKEFQAS
jgi:hypothetical protein